MSDKETRLNWMEERSDEGKTLIKKLTRTAQLPEYKSERAAGVDLHADLIGRDAEDMRARPSHLLTDEKGPKLVLEPGDIVLVPTGIAMAIPEGHEGQIRSRSGLSLKRGLIVANAPGTVDSDYRGEFMIILTNISREQQYIRHGERIAQLVITRVERADFREVHELDETERGSGGFGSTGV